MSTSASSARDARMSRFAAELAIKVRRGDLSADTAAERLYRDTFGAANPENQVAPRGLTCGGCRETYTSRLVTLIDPGFCPDCLTDREIRAEVGAREHLRHARELVRLRAMVERR